MRNDFARGTQPGLFLKAGKFLMNSRRFFTMVSLTALILPCWIARAMVARGPEPPHGRKASSR